MLASYDEFNLTTEFQQSTWLNLFSVFPCCYPIGLTCSDLADSAGGPAPFRGTSGIQGKG